MAGYFHCCTFAAGWYTVQCSAVVCGAVVDSEVEQPFVGYSLSTGCDESAKFTLALCNA